VVLVIGKVSEKRLPAAGNVNRDWNPSKKYFHVYDTYKLWATCVLC